jgi:hypothetical protein
VAFGVKGSVDISPTTIPDRSTAEPAVKPQRRW